MLVQASRLRPASAYVIVVGNEKGGAGKSTIAMHIAVGLMQAGQRVATVDLDVRQRSLTDYVENRRAWARHAGTNLEIPTHFCVSRGSTRKLDENEKIEFTGFVDVLTAVELTHDFIVIDTAGADSHLMRLAHSMASTLVTPLNDSFVDFNVLGKVDPENYAVTGESHYAKMVREARQQRRQVDGSIMDWIVVRNRVSFVESRNQHRIAQGLKELSIRLGFRFANAVADRVIYREFFPRGLTALDKFDQNALDARASLSHAAAQQEIAGLIETLKLPLDERGQRRAAAHAEWAEARENPIELHDFIAE